MKNNYLAVFLSLLLFISLVATAYWYKHTILHAENSLPVTKPCDLHKAPCYADLPSGERLSFSISPQNIPLLKPLQLSLEKVAAAESIEQKHTQSFRIDQAEVLIVGLNMDMGWNHTVLEAQTAERFVGTTTLPICTLERMEWQALVSIKQDDQKWVIPFDFYTLNAN